MSDRRADKSLWNKGGPVDAAMMRYTARDDHVLDQQLLAFDLLASKAHVRGLCRVGALDPNERDRCVTTATGEERSGTAFPRLPRGAASRQLAFHQPPDVVLAEFQRLQPVDRRSHDRRGFLHDVGAGRDRVADEHAGAMPQLDDALAFEVAIGPNYGVRVDQQVLGHLSHAGKLLAGLDRTSGNRVLQVLDELHVERGAERRVQVQMRQLYALSIQYTRDAILASRRRIWPP